MPRYAVGAGLLEDKTYGFTPLGATVFEHDPMLTHPVTLWLMHYHLSAPKGPGPSYWHYLASREMQIGAELDPKELTDKTRSFLKETEGSTLADRSARTLVTVFTGTYTKSDALGRLGLLEEVDGKGQEKTFEVLEPEPPPLWAVGYALAHYWESVWGDMGLVNLSELSESGGFSTLMFLGAYQLNSTLRQLQSEGLLELWQVAPPHQIARSWSEKGAFLKRLYE